MNARFLRSHEVVSPMDGTNNPAISTKQRNHPCGGFFVCGYVVKKNPSGTFLILKRPSEDGQQIIVGLNKRKFTPPQAILLQSENALVSVTLQLPSGTGNQADYQDWINVGQKLLKTLEPQAITCN